MKESVELAPLEAKEDSTPFAATVAPTLKPESKIDREEKITKLLEEIEAIKIANSKVADAKLREIPLEAVADDISMAGQSIEERQAAIQHLKHEGSSKKHWWQKAAVIGGMLLTGLFAAKEASGQKVGDKKIKTKIENISQSKEKQKEDILKFLTILENKNNTSKVSPEDMDILLEKIKPIFTEREPEGTLDSLQLRYRHVLKQIYDKHSPYSIEGLKPNIPNLVPGYDLAIVGRENKILFNTILNNVDFDNKEINDQMSYREIEGYGKVFTGGVGFTKKFETRKIKGRFNWGNDRGIVSIESLDGNESFATAFFSPEEPEEESNRDFAKQFSLLLKR